MTDETATQGLPEPPPLTSASTISEYRDTRTVSDRLRLRRSASLRCEPLLSGRRDPWHPSRPPLTDRQISAWLDAVEHLERHDLTPVVDLDTRQALWRKGHRNLAVRLHSREVN